MTVRHFRKMHGCGNSFLVAMATRAHANEFLSQIKKACSPNFGIGSDGVMLIEAANGGGFEVYMYNPDASPMGMCGNGIRCVAKFLYDNGSIKANAGWVPFMVEGRTVECRVHDNGQRIEVNMGAPRFEPHALPMNREKPALNEILTTNVGDFQFSAVSMGNPHCVIFTPNPEAIELPTIGPIIENHPDFPKRINVEFVAVRSPRLLDVRVWERGAGITLACGTGACASLVAGAKTGRCETQAEVRLPGGSVVVEWDQQRNLVFMTGPAENVAELEFLPEWLGAS